MCVGYIDSILCKEFEHPLEFGICRVEVLELIPCKYGGRL
jgi:hypothetical protein